MAKLVHVEFPPVDNTEKIKLQRFIKTTSEFMEVDFEVGEVTIVRVSVAADRQDVATLLRKVAANEKRKQLHPQPKPAEGE